MHFYKKSWRQFECVVNLCIYTRVYGGHLIERCFLLPRLVWYKFNDSGEMESFRQETRTKELKSGALDSRYLLRLRYISCARSLATSYLLTALISAYSFLFLSHTDEIHKRNVQTSRFRW